MKFSRSLLDRPIIDHDFPAKVPKYPDRRLGNLYDLSQVVPP